MTSYRVFRDIPGRQRQYLRRAVSFHAVLWHDDQALAQRFCERHASNWALVMRRRTETYPGHAASEPVGHYDYEEAKP